MDSIIFDLDGTLWDSTPTVAKAWNHTLLKETNKNYDITAESLKKLFGRLLSDIADILFVEKEKDEREHLIDLCCESEHLAIANEPPAPYNGVKEMLEILSRKYPLFIVSNCQAGYIELFLEVTGLSSYFKGHLCPGDTGFAKSYNIQQVIQQYNLLAPIYVGDTQGDATACKSANVPFVFAKYGFGENIEAQATINSPLELVDVVTHL